MEKPKILVIDDEEVSRDAVQKALKREGYDLFFAENGAEGLTVFQTVWPVVVILDLRMPVMDGTEFLKKINGILEQMIRHLERIGTAIDNYIQFHSSHLLISAHYT